MSLTIHFHLVPMIRMDGVIHPPTLMSLGRKETIFFYFTVVHLYASHNPHNQYKLLFRT